MTSMQDHRVAYKRNNNLNFMKWSEQLAFEYLLEIKRISQASFKEKNDGIQGINAFNYFLSNLSKSMV